MDKYFALELFLKTSDNCEILFFLIKLNLVLRTHRRSYSPFHSEQPLSDRLDIQTVNINNNCDKKLFIVMVEL